MALTVGQKRALHAAARQAGVPDPIRRLIQQRVAGVESAADPRFGRHGYIGVMADLEGIAGGRLRGCTPGYWAAQRDASRTTDALVHRVLAEGRRLGMTDSDLNRFLASPRMSSGRFDRLAAAPAAWLLKMIEALKAMARRNRARAAGRNPTERAAVGDT